MTTRIIVQCPACQKRMAVSSQFEGKRIKCPGCSQPVGVARPTASVPAGAKARSAERPVKPLVAKATSAVAERGSTGRPTSPSSTEPTDRRVTNRGVRQKKKRSRQKQAATASYEDDWLNDPGIASTGSAFDDSPDGTYAGSGDSGGANLPPRTRKKRKKSSKPKLKGTGNEPLRPVSRHTMPLGDRMISGGGLKGLLMMGGAGVWFIAGLAAGYIYFYPPVMFIIGLGLFAKAVFGEGTYA